jgi:hypothetical protein
MNLANGEKKEKYMVTKNLPILLNLKYNKNDYFVKCDAMSSHNRAEPILKLKMPTTGDGLDRKRQNAAGCGILRPNL